MTNERWIELKIGDAVHGGFQNQEWIVFEIAEDERTLNHWKDKYSIDIVRVVKLIPTDLSFNGSHTWSGIPDKWSIKTK